MQSDIHEGKRLKIRIQIYKIRISRSEAQMEEFVGKRPGDSQALTFENQ